MPFVCLMSFEISKTTLKYSPECLRQEKQNNIQYQTANHYHI